MHEGKKRALRALGYVFCILPAALAALEHFPLWLSESKSGVSLLGVLVLFLCLLPFKRGVLSLWKNPSAWFLWLCLLVFLKVALPLAEGLLAVAGVAFPCSLLGALCFRLAQRLHKEGEA